MKKRDGEPVAVQIESAQQVAKRGACGGIKKGSMGCVDRPLRTRNEEGGG